MPGRTPIAIAAMLSGSLAAASEFVVTEGPLSDGEFYELVSCAAPPGEACARDPVRWDATRAQALRVGLLAIDPEFADYKLAEVLRALERAIEEINASGARLQLVLAEPGARVDIPILLTGTKTGETLDGTGVAGLDGRAAQPGLVSVLSDGGVISQAAIALSADIPRRAIASVLLEELVQALGLMTDIRNPYYRRRSVFDEDGNSVTRLGDQDRMALRRHYPPPQEP